MNLVVSFLHRFLDVLVGIVTQAIPAFRYTFGRLSAQLKARGARKKLSHFERSSRRTGCQPVRHPAFQRPDPLIYSQQYLQKLGLAVTWDNPDIILLKDGVVAPEGAVLPDTDYEIDATIWNNSYEAPAVGVGVEFAFYSFGAGAVLNPIGTKSVNLGVKGGANHPAHARIKWHTPAAPGHYCILVTLSWFDDLNPYNNVGQNNIDVVHPASPAVSTFQLRNDTGEPQRYHFAVDAYTLPTQPQCRKPTDPRPTNDQRWNEIKARHRPADFPVPPGWTVVLTPPSPSLAAGDKIDVTVTITPPTGFTGRQAINVHALYGNNQPAGGATIYVEAP